MTTSTQPPIPAGACGQGAFALVDVHSTVTAGVQQQLTTTVYTQPSAIQSVCTQPPHPQPSSTWTAATLLPDTQPPQPPVLCILLMLMFHLVLYSLFGCCLLVYTLLLLSLDMRTHLMLDSLALSLHFFTHCQGVLMVCSLSTLSLLAPSLYLLTPWVPSLPVFMDIILHII